MTCYDIARDLDGRFTFETKRFYEAHGTATPFGFICDARARVLDLPLPVVMYYRNPDGLGLVMAPVGDSVHLQGLDTSKCREPYYIEHRRENTLAYDDFSSGKTSVTFVIVNSNSHKLFSNVTCDSERSVSSLVSDCMDRYNAIYAPSKTTLRPIAPKIENRKMAV